VQRNARPFETAVDTLLALAIGTHEGRHRQEGMGF
jgi:hypothetical protein